LAKISEFALIFKITECPNKRVLQKKKNMLGNNNRVLLTKRPKDNLTNNSLIPEPSHWKSRKYASEATCSKTWWWQKI